MWLLIMRVERRDRNVSSLGVASKQCMMASRVGMGSFGPNKWSMSIKKRVTCDRRPKARAEGSHQASRRGLTWTKRSLSAPSGPRFRSLGEVDQPPICCFVGPEARLGLMRGDVCGFCLWKSLDGIISSACRRDVPLHLSGNARPKVFRGTYLDTCVWSSAYRGMRRLHILW